MDLPVGISALQHTDRWLGAPLCAVLTLVRKVFGPGRPSRACPVHKILFIKFAEQGSTVLAYPAICRATEMVGRENVYFVVFEDNRFILDVMEIVPEQNVITISTKSPFALATGAFRAILRARKIDIDAVIDMDLTANAKLLPAVLRPKGSVIVYGTGPEATIPAAFCLVNSIRLQFFLVYELDATERERAIATIDSALKQGVLLNRVAQPTFRLDDIAAAHEAVERGSLGNVLMRP